MDGADEANSVRYLRYDEELGVLLTLWGDRPAAAEDLAASLQQVSEEEWRDAVESTLVPFDPDLN